MSTVAIEHIPFGASSSAACAPILAACHAVRRIVFVDEQQVEAALEWDDLDELAEHFLARRDDDGTPLGTARLRIVGGHAKAERVAVHAFGLISVFVQRRGRGDPLFELLGLNERVVHLRRHLGEPRGRGVELRRIR